MALFFYKEKNKDIRAAAYLRLSIEDGDKAESNSIGNQRELIRDFAAERPGLYLVEEYADDGYTGTNFERPGFKRMMEDIKSGKINCIIVKDLSRLGRNYIEMGKYLEQIFPMMGIRFIAINDNYDNANTESSDSDSIVVPFKNLLNDSYCRDISIKVRSQLDMKRRKGEFIGGYAIYGYCKDKRNKNRLVVDEYAADIVRSIYRRKLEGMSAQAIAEQLNSENVLAPSEYKRLCGLNYHSGFKAGTHAKWQAIQVLRILKNEIYTGTMVQGRRQKINYKIIAENCHEPYITKEQFYAFPCNMREGENKISIRKSYKKPNPLAKHIVCTCGYALCWHKDKKTEEELFYCRHCRAHKENGKNLKVPAATIYKKVMDALELEHLEEEKLAAAIQQGAGRKVIEAVRAEKSVQMKSVLAELNMEQFRRVPLYESYMADEITKEQYCAELLDYEEAHRKLNEQLTAIMEDTLVWERALSLRNPWIQQMAQYKTPEELDRNFVKKYIEQVTVTLLNDGQVEISLTMKTDEWKQMLSRIEVEGTDSGTKE